MNKTKEFSQPRLECSYRHLLIVKELARSGSWRESIRFTQPHHWFCTSASPQTLVACPRSAREKQKTLGLTSDQEHIFSPVGGEVIVGMRVSLTHK